VQKDECVQCHHASFDRLPAVWSVAEVCIFVPGGH
jgi:hypothetical protein